ncbi:hypothetical protein DL770_011900 [Monosporascus sp. CRB-9-2]|nr:hypothetical protein DL770_011900 [Monosporascus sp. CRB-9-2]
MRFTTLITATLLAAQQAIASPEELPELGELNVASSEVITETEEIESHLAKRQFGNWCVLFYTGYECDRDTYGAWCGNGPANCVAINGPDRARSLGWMPMPPNTLHIRVSTSDHCSNGCCGSVFGPGEGGCRRIPANQAQSGISSFHVY